MTSARDDRTARLLVGVQFVLLALVALGVWPQIWTPPLAVRLVGVALCIAGGALALVAAFQIRRALTALPLPNARTELMTTGAFAICRHPIYLGLLVAAVGWVALFGGAVSAVATVALGVLLHVKSGFEERHLRQRFVTYDDYTRRTPSLLPFPRGTA